tara:strand:- start:8232 stop:9863 length:1632 start_codon:yes stop_codon:yes gene_type:complete
MSLSKKSLTGQKNSSLGITKDKISDGLKYIAAIDIGTNSTHLLIAKINFQLKTFSIEFTEKVTTRLGEKDENGNLTSVSMQRVIEVLKRFKEYSTSYKVEQLIASATSAVREAPNGRSFIDKVSEELEINIELISGIEEARLIYLGVLSGMPFEDKDHLIIDIGGGSTELILANDREARALTSTRVGAVRIKRDFMHTDPLPSKRVEFLKTFIKGSLEPAVNKILGRITPGDYPICVATSGTALAIGALIANEEGKNKTKLHGYKISKKKLNIFINKILKFSPLQRKKLTPLSDRRSEIIVPGALILNSVMEMIGSSEIILCERALREGLIVDWMLRNGLLENRFSIQGDIRSRTILHQLNRFKVNKQRSEIIADFSLLLYERSYGILHSDSGEGKELLWAAAMLHKCGNHINISSYHKHSWYLIRHGELLGYSQSEHLMIAAIARYHRKSLPKKRHEAWQEINNQSQKIIVSQMSLLLRLSAAINKRPESKIDNLKVEILDENIFIELISNDSNSEISLEKWNLRNCAEVVKEITGKDLIVK